MATRYPILLVNGLGLRDDLRAMPYWGRLPEQLRGLGYAVHGNGKDAFGTIAQNAAALKATAVRILDQTGAPKLNLLAHPKGGLDARWMVSHLGMAERVASLTTLSTPHLGASLARLALDFLEGNALLPTARGLVGLYARLAGDRGPRVEEAVRELSPEAMLAFNAQVPDRPGVFYQSFAAELGPLHPSAYNRAKQAWLGPLEGPGDGVVAVASARWGELGGILRGVSHFEMTGRVRQGAFRALPFYTQLLDNLAQRGF